ncbi:MAG: FISUMP domain-containing protein [Bacteroidota bacterium]
MKKKVISLILTKFIILIFSSPVFSQENIITDERDGKQYKTVRIGHQVWMAENIDFESENSWWYNDKKRYRKKYGRLYTWSAAMNACPSGWHLPSDEEWTKLIGFYGGEKFAAKELSIVGRSGFDVRFSGLRDSTGVFYDIGHDANFWSSISVEKNNAWRCFFTRGYNDVVQDYYSKEGGLSVRCIQD